MTAEPLGSTARRSSEDWKIEHPLGDRRNHVVSTSLVPDVT